MKYERKIKKDWSAKWIWSKEEETSKNAWLCFNKTVSLDVVPKQLTAHIAAESRYLLYVNGNIVVREGGLRRGPTPNGCYYDEVDIAPFLKCGENKISVLVWYWGKLTSFSSTDAGQGGLLFEAISDEVSIISNNTWKVMRHPAFKECHTQYQPNIRLPESNVYYDARDELRGWIELEFDCSKWEDATEYDVGGNGVWGDTYRREIPLFKDFGLKDYISCTTESNVYTLRMPYNAQITPYLKVNAVAGKEISIITDNTVPQESLHSTYVTKDGVQEFESPMWFNGEKIIYTIPDGVEVLSLKYRESGYNTEFCGDFKCGDEKLNTLWQKSLRTLYVTMRDNFMDCPDRERAQWWGDATNEMMLSMYCLDTASYLLYRKGVSTMLAHVNPESKVLYTVVPITNREFELPMQQLAGICGFLYFYNYTGDKDFLNQIYTPAIDYLNLWELNDDGLVVHRAGTWDWPDWGEKFDVPVLENAWYYFALSTMLKIAKILGDEENCKTLAERMSIIYNSFQKLWCQDGYKSSSAENYDDRGNAVAVLAGLCPAEYFPKMKELLFNIRNSSPYMEYYVLEALCSMGEYELAKNRICERYHDMITEDYSTLWEFWQKEGGTMNHAWSGGPLVIMSRYFAGIEPLEPGYASMKIAPKSHIDNNIFCTVPTVKGKVVMSCVTEENHTVINVNIPENVKTYIHLPNNETVVCVNKVEIFDGESLCENCCAEYDSSKKIIIITK